MTKKQNGVLIVIPARFGSSRFPGKPLAVIHGRSMIERVYAQCKNSKLASDVIVATDDSRIFDHVKEFGGNVVMTSGTHQSGTDRCGEVARSMMGKSEIIINVQGDEPFISAGQIDLLISCFQDATCQIATLVRPISNYAKLKDAHIVKVVRAKNGMALYFSRSMVPFAEDNISSETPYFQHIGIYGYKADVLQQLVKMEQSPLEIAERLEQLRWLENGYQIQTAITEEKSYSVDIPEDIKRIESRFDP